MTSLPRFNNLVFNAVVDDRGRWAVCGKSTGILAFKTMPGLNDSESNIGRASMEVMPLVSGHLHLPLVTLQRYMKRKSSEFGGLIVRILQSRHE